MFDVRATYHTTLQASPMQLVFIRDSILNIKHVADWEHIRQRKQLRINHNNKRENMRRNNHKYKVGDKILIKRKQNSKHELEFMGPFPHYANKWQWHGSLPKENHQWCHQYSQNKTILQLNNKRVFTTTVVSLYQNDNGTVHFQQGIFNDTTDYTSIITHQWLHINISYFTFMISRTLIIGAIAVYHVSFNC